MKKFIVTAGIGSVLYTLILTGNVVGATIQDNYIGGIQYGSTVYGTLPDGSAVPDVLGTPPDLRYSLDNISITFNHLGTTQIDIYGAYFSHVIVNDSIDLGDLFLSNNGWKPIMPTNLDTYQFGEFWEFALVPNDHSGATSSGTASLYSISNISEYVLAENATTSVTNRYGQEVLLNTSGKTAIGTGSWNLYSDHLSFTISTNLLNFGTDDLGVRWTMTCANDIIEGSAPVPEPATVFLFGAGLATLAGFRTRKKRE